ncbi:hypothetical protein VTH06DRAFT_5474 [Thermothelomyces fergusii]
MMSLRAIARSAPRVLARASTTYPSRTASSFLKARPASLIRPLQVSAFSTSSPFRKAAAGGVDEEVSAKLASEIEFEDSVELPVPTTIKDFLENSPFKVQDVPGKENVVLTRTFGDEKITVTFSIADFHDYDPDMMEDSALDEELDDIESGSNRQDRGGSANLEEESEEESRVSIPSHLNIVIEKPNKGALAVEAVAQDGAIMVENMYYYTNPKLAHNADPEAVHELQDTYAGPPFGNLDEDLQILMERYLEERGITESLAVFVPEYIDYKEQREYVAWLKNVKKFVDA